MFVKAVSGGGGRGMRRVTDPSPRCPRRSRPPAARPSRRSAIRRCTSSRRCINPRHIEVQILADTARQRDAPVRTRLQRAASAPEGHRTGARAEPARRTAAEDLCRRGRVRPSDRLHVCGHRGVPARRARPLRVHRDEPAHPGRAHRHRGDHRRRPGRQPAAHRRRGDAGRPRAEPGHAAASAVLRCSAGSPPRTRPTASAPTPAASPPTDRRAARASGSTAARIWAPRSARTSTRCWSSSPVAGRDFATAVARARRALAEFRVRGVSTNIPFLQAVVDDPDFRAGRITTSFIDERPVLC